MKYILLMTGTQADFKWYASWPKQDLQAHAAFMRSLSKELQAAGALVATVGLAFPDEAMIVHAGADGVPVTDGVFPESKEFLAGYWIVDVETPERAYEIAARISAQPGPGGVAGSAPIEVRQIMDGPPEKLP